MPGGRRRLLGKRRTMTRTAFLKLGLATALAPLLGGCAPGPAPVSQSSKDPSNPKAAEGANPLVAAASPHPMQATSTAGDALVYVCPMHPEVTSTQPDQVCPK